jgi:hypothetical protein
MKNYRIRRPLLATGVFLLTASALSIVAVSPFALGVLSRFKSNWALLSNIGQTYGAVSALLAAIALAGVVVTVMLQIKESRLSRADAIRARHFDLYKAIIEDPTLAETTYGVSQFASPEERKQVVFINLQLQFWLMLWDLGHLPENTLRNYISDVLKTEVGRAYWRVYGTTRSSSTTAARKEAKFLRIVNEEYLLLSGSTLEQPLDRPDESGRRISALIIAGSLIGLAAGAVLERTIARRMAHRKSGI